MNIHMEESRQRKEKEILAFLQRRHRTKTLKNALKSEAIKGKKATKNMNCTFCRNTILRETIYVSFKSQGEVTYKGKTLRTERMHEPCLNRYLA